MLDIESGPPQRPIKSLDLSKAPAWASVNQEQRGLRPITATLSLAALLLGCTAGLLVFG
jgi:hypothetical protein